MSVTALQTRRDAPSYPACLMVIETEATLLGGLMMDNTWIDRVADRLTAEDFFEPLHGRIYTAMLECSAAGRPANPVILRPLFVDDPAMQDLGGPAYLARLTTSPAALLGLSAFADQIADTARRRRVYDALQASLADLARAENLTQPVETVIEGVDNALSGVLTVTSKAPQSRSLAKAVDSTLRKIDDEASGKSVPGIRLADFEDFNRLTGNMRRGEEMILAGRPGMGKTAVALRIALCSAAAGNGTAFFSLEMMADELTRRALADLVFEWGQNPTYEQIREAKLNPYERQRLQEARDRIADWPLEILDPPSLKIGRLVREIRRVQRKFAAKGQTLDVVILDYLGLIKPDRESGSRYNDVALISRTLKEISKACNIALVVLAQLNRKVEEREDKRPHLHDLRDAGDIEQDADTVMFVYRDEYYLTKSEPPPGDKRRADWEVSLQAARDRLELIVAKRRGGREGRRTCHFFGAHQAVRDGNYFQDMGR